MNRLTRATMYVNFLCLFFFVMTGPVFSAGPDRLSLTVTPPLFQVTVSPGEVWQSTLKVVNTNPYDLTIYASVMNFAAYGEVGRGQLTPLIQDTLGDQSLAVWVKVSPDPITIPPQTSADIPFSIQVPSNAEPGGHYAAILVGTQPVGDKTAGASVLVSSQVTSLIFLRVNGDVKEEGNIREFRPERFFYQNPVMNFILRFENSGNVDLHPQGDIVIYNLWGEERGRILINQENGFGNVLPRTIRQFMFPWQGEQRFWEAGRYTAIATLSFGRDLHQNVFQSASFWVFPIKPALGIAAGISGIVGLIVWAIRRYIRKSLASAARELGLGAAKKSHPAAPKRLSSRKDWRTDE